MWEHFAYKDVSPPHDVAILRDTSIVLITISFISIIIVSSFIVTKKYRNQQDTPQDLKWNVFMAVVFALYLASGVFSLYVEYYYSWGSNRHSIPSSVEILNYISLGYFAIVTIIIVIVALAHAPPELACLI